MKGSEGEKMTKKEGRQRKGKGIEEIDRSSQKGRKKEKEEQKSKRKGRKDKGMEGGRVRVGKEKEAK